MKHKTNIINELVKQLSFLRKDFIDIYSYVFNKNTTSTPVEHKNDNVHKAIDTKNTHANNELLEVTAQAFNSQMVVYKLRENILRTTISDKPKKSRYIFKDNQVQYIYDILYRDVPAGYFWEDFLYIICQAIITYQFEKASSMGVYRETEGKMKSYKRLLCIETSLKEHTLDVMREYEEYKSNIAYQQKFIVAASCLLHDFGKSIRLVESMGQNAYKNYRHTVDGYTYILKVKEKLIRDYQDLQAYDDVCQYQMSLIDKIAEGVLGHHDNNFENYTVPRYVNIIDMKAREKAWNRFVEQDCKLEGKNLEIRKNSDKEYTK